MDSVKTNLKNFIEDKRGRCIGSVISIPENGMHRIYVAWEWRNMAEQGFFGFCKANKLYTGINEDVLAQVCDYGDDISGTTEGNKIFKHIIKSNIK